LYNARLEILDKEVQKWMDEGAGGLFKKSGLDKARVVKEGQAKERGDIDAQIKNAQDRIEKLRAQYATQVKEYNDRVAAIESRSKGQRGDIEASIKKLEKDIEEIMASIDAYNKESDNKISSLNSKKDELVDAGKKEGNRLSKPNTRTTQSKYRVQRQDSQNRCGYIQVYC
jgi:chromosome segregation ATPase